MRLRIGYLHVAAAGFPSRPGTLSRLVDGSAWAPRKGVASCDKPRGGACSLRSGDPRMGPPAMG